jgi:hypothetical protein
MKTIPPLAFAMGLLLGDFAAYGMATSRTGPDSANRSPTVQQPGWPSGILDILRRDSRVYSFWVNGNENFYFEADNKEINELIRLFSQIHLRDHEVVLKLGKPIVSFLQDQKFGYNVNLHLLGGIAFGATRAAQEPKTLEPTLTIHVAPEKAAALLKSIELQPNIILRNELPDSALKGPKVRPVRKTWHAAVQFDDGTPAVDFNNKVITRVACWQQGNTQPIKLGQVTYKGRFHAAFSDLEMAGLKAGDLWLTTTTGSWSTELKPTHPRLKVESLKLSDQDLDPVKLQRPRFFHGRLLFDDGSPPHLDPAPWPGAKIGITFPQVGKVTPDKYGFFKVFLSDAQFEQAKENKPRKNIYVPNPKRRNRSTARFAFPVNQLSKSKSEAGVVKIPRPTK